MFVQQYNGYYYLTQKWCGLTSKVYLGKDPTKIDNTTAINKLHEQLFAQIKKSESFLSFLNLLPQYTQHKVEDILAKTIRTLFEKYDSSKFLYDFVYHSNKSEGSKIAYEDFMSIVHRQIPSTSNRNEIQEVKNSFLARDFLMDGFIRNETSIKKLHKILTKGLLSDAGVPYETGYKQHNNIVGNVSTTDHTKVTESMQHLLSRYKAHKKANFPLHLAFEFHYKFERIHPFADGNGRIGRLLMNKILHDNQYIPLTIFSENRTAYFRAFEYSMEKGSHILYEFLINQYKKSLKV